MLSFSFRPSSSLLLGSLRASSGIPGRIIRRAASAPYDRLPLNTLTVPELKDMLRAQGRPVSGKKADLIDRLGVSSDTGIDQPVNANPAASRLLDTTSNCADTSTSAPVVKPAATVSESMKLNFLELQPGELVALLKSWGQPAYRANQVYIQMKRKS